MTARGFAGRDDVNCKCPACLESERLGAETGIGYCYQPSRVRVLFHLALHLSVPAMGMVLIGWSWLALVPIGGFAAAYLFNAFHFCPTCTYHHGDAAFCVCYPKSVFSRKRYRGYPWRNKDNIIGWPVLVALSIGPTLTVLASRGDHNAMILLVVHVIALIFVMSASSCPVCRQRSFCYLGKLTMKDIARRDT